MNILRTIQKILLGISLVLLVYIPLVAAFGDLRGETIGQFYDLSFFAVFLVMLIRPLSDIFPHYRWLRRLVLLRKGLGVLSASIVVGFVVGDIIAPDSHYIASIFTREYWSLTSGLLFAHIGDITGFILLITSNNLSVTLLKKRWKTIQKLAYVYFYAGGLYEMYAFNKAFAFWAMLLVTVAIIIAFIKNHSKKRAART